MTRLFVATLAVAIALSAGTAAAATGGLSIAPAFLEKTANPGATGAIQVRNSTNKTMAITVAARPWIQSRDGVTRPDGRSRLAGISLSATKFTLAPGQSRSVSATLTRRPAARSLYGVVEVIGVPQQARSGNAVITRYRLLSGLRLNPAPAARRYRVAVGTARSSRARTLVAVRNGGNTVAPISGSARITGASGTLRTTISAQRILPGKIVDIGVRRGRLRPGSYLAAITLRQGGRNVATVTRRFVVR